MGRRQLYNTPEEKIAANRAKSKRYYEKEKDKINKERREQYFKHHPKPITEIPSLPTTRTPLETWKERAEQIQRYLDRRIARDRHLYVDNICTEFIETGNKDPIHGHVIALGKLQKSAYRCENEVLSLDGVGPSLEAVRNVVRNVNEVIGWVEEVFCYAIVDIAEVKSIHSAKGFMYQKK